ncbi:hypothetical protein RPSD_52210 (plasmid) [Ralstonia solanacearum]|nr:hypothetical protein RPSD_52210 [Ralstonia solanacearum]
MAIKETILRAGLVLGGGLMAIPFVTKPAPALFALPRDAASYADFQARLTWGNWTAVAGLVIFIVCLAVIARRTWRRGAR